MKRLLFLVSLLACSLAHGQQLQSWGTLRQLLAANPNTGFTNAWVSGGVVTNDGYAMVLTYYPLATTATNAVPQGPYAPDPPYSGRWFPQSYWYRVGANGMGIDTNIYFGPGTTNVLQRDAVTASYLNYTNGYSAPRFQVIQGSGTKAWLGAGVGGSFLGTSGSTASWGTSGQTLYQGINTFYPDTDNAMDWGTEAYNISTVNQRTNIVYGFHGTGLELTNYSRLSTSHGGTNDAIHFDSQAAGTAGNPVPMVFSLGGVPAGVFRETNFFAPTAQFGVQSNYWTTPRPDVSGYFQIGNRGSGVVNAMEFQGGFDSTALSSAMMHLDVGDWGVANHATTYGMSVVNGANSASADPTGDQTDGTIAGWFSAEGDGKRNLGLVGASSGEATNNIAVLARADTQHLDGVTNIAMKAEIAPALPGHTPTQIAGFFDAGTQAASAVNENAMVLIDNRATGYPLIVARTNNGTTVFTLDGAGNVTASGTISGTVTNAANWSASGATDSSLAGTATIKGGLALGTNTVSYWGTPATANIISTVDTALGDPNANEFYMETHDSVNHWDTSWDMMTTTNRLFVHASNTTDGHYHLELGGTGNTWLELSTTSMNDAVLLWPDATAGPFYTFGSSTAISTNRELVTVKNGPASVFTVSTLGDSSLAGTATVGTGIALTNGILSITNGTSSIRFETNAGQANPCLSFLPLAGTGKTYLGPSRVLEFRGGTSPGALPPYDLSAYFTENGTLYSGVALVLSNKRSNINGNIDQVGLGEGQMLSISTDVNGSSVGIEAYSGTNSSWWNATALAVYDLEDIIPGTPTAYSPGYGKKKWALDSHGTMYWGSNLTNAPRTNATITLEPTSTSALTLSGSLNITTALNLGNGTSTAPSLQFTNTGSALGFYAPDVATIGLAATALGGANPPFAWTTGGAFKISQYAELVFTSGSALGADDAWMSRPAAGRILVGRSGSPNTLETSGNFASDISVGSTTYLNAKFRSQTNQVAGALTFAHCTNGVDGLDITVTRWLFNSSGSDQTLSFPIIAAGVNGWRTNVYSAVPPAITNGTIMKVILDVGGPTDTLARQTNCYVKFEYYQ